MVGVAALTAIVVCAQAWAWPWQKKLAKGPPVVELEDVMKRPDAYSGREVRFTCRFALQGKLFKHFNTRFNAAEHANFAVWPLDTRLWDKAERRNVLPTLYVDKSKKPSFEALRNFKRYEKIEVTGKILNTYAGLPWLLVTDLKSKSDDASEITDTTIVHIRHGLQLLGENKPALAVRHLELATEAGIPSEQKSDVLKSLAKSHAGAGNTAEAVGFYKETIEAGGADAETHLELAKLQLKTGDVEGAIVSCKVTLSLSPDFPEAHAVMGEAYAKQGEVSQAMEQANLAVEIPGIDPQQKAMAIVHRARILVAAKRYADAIREYAKAISGDSELSGVAWLRKEIGQLYESRYDATLKIALLDDAKREYANANVLANNTDVESLYLAARVTFKQAKAEGAGDFGKALGSLEESLKVDSQYLPSLILKGEIKIAEGKSEEAEKIFLQVAEISGGNADALLKLSDAYEKNGKLDKAKAICEKIQALDPSNRAALQRYAELSEKLGDPAAARTSYETLVALAPADTSYRWRLGHILMAQGDFAGAAEHLAVASQAPGALGEDAGVLQARALVLNGDYGSAESVLRKVLKRNSDNVGAMAALSLYLSDQSKRPSEALSLAKRALSADPKNPELLDICGWAEVRAGQRKAALATLAKIPDGKMSRSAYYHLAVAKYYEEDFAGAREALSNVITEVQAGEIQAEAERLIESGKALLQMLDKAEASAARQARHARERAPAAKEPTVETLPATEEGGNDPVENAIASEQTEPAKRISVAAQVGARTTEEDFLIEIPGVPGDNMDDISSLAPETGKEPVTRTNTVENLPLPESGPRSELLEDVAALVDLVEGEDAEPEELPMLLDSDNAPVERVISEPAEESPAMRKAPAIRIEEKEEIRQVAPTKDLEKPEDLPKNNISDLPDWAM